MDYGTHAGSRASGIIRSILSWAFFFVSVLALIWLIQNFVARAYAIPSGSMEDTIEIGDQVWSEKISYYLREPAYGDLITFDDPRTTFPSRIPTPFPREASGSWATIAPALQTPGISARSRRAPSRVAPS